MASFYEQGNELSDSLECWEFLDLMTIVSQSVSYRNLLLPEMSVSNIDMSFTPGTRANRACVAHYRSPEKDS
jgi:hypothetical protein